MPASGEAQQHAREAIRDAQMLATSMNHKGWEFNKRQGYGRNAGGYKTGTVAVTQDSTAVTGTGTAWTAAMVGWRFALTSGQQEVYEVVARGSGTALTLDRPFEGETESAAAYRLYDPFAICPADVARLISVQFEYAGCGMAFVDLATMRWNEPRPVLFAEGLQAIFSIGKPTTTPRYSTGTVTLAEGDATVTLATGTFPAWVVNRHIRFQNESVLYKVLSRTDDTHAEMDRNYKGLWAGASRTYEIDPPGCLRLEIEFPQEDQFSYKIDYYCTPQELVNDTDVLEGPDEYARAVVNLAKGYTMQRVMPWGELGDAEKLNWMTRVNSAVSLGDRQLKALMEGNVAPEQGAYFRNYCRD